MQCPPPPDSNFVIQITAAMAHSQCGFTSPMLPTAGQKIQNERLPSTLHSCRPRHCGTRPLLPAKSGRPFWPMRRCPLASLMGNGGSRSGDSSSNAGSCGQRIATAFIAACMPGGKPYAEQMADFSRAVLSAYRSGFSLNALQLEMGGADTTSMLGRSLQSDEVELRSVWLALAYKTMRYLRVPSSGLMDGAGATGESTGAFDRDRLDDFVQGICIASEKGYDQKRIQLEQSLNSSDSSPSSPLENAILQQSVRIVLTTIAVAKEEGENNQQTEWRE